MLILLPSGQTLHFYMALKKTLCIDIFSNLHYYQVANWERERVVVPLLPKNYLIIIG